MSIQEITDETFKEKVIKSSKPFCLKFETDWCGPCKTLTPIVEEISNELTDIDFGAMNIDSHPNTPTEYGVRGIPTLLIFNGGTPVDQLVGALPKKAIKDKLDNILNNINGA